MSLQVFLQAQLLGAEAFLASVHSGRVEAANDLAGRCAWLTLIGEALPRALLAELKLSRMLLGSSSAEQFLLVLAEEDIPRANEFLAHAADSISRLSANTLRLVWASTENLGTWPVVRKRLDDALSAKICCPLPEERPGDAFAPFIEPVAAQAESVFAEFAAGLMSASSVNWSSENPLLLTWEGGDFHWALREHSSLEEDSILFPRRFAMDENQVVPAELAELAARAEGAPRWGILRGDVDHFELQLRRAGSVEEHIHFSALFKEFFAGELAVLCALPDFWRKISMLYRGGDDFAVIGSWDALIQMARELERVFSKFVEQHLAGLPGVEAKSISMALVMGPESTSSPAAVFAEAGIELQTAKSTELGSIHLFGRNLEWKRLNDAEELKSSLVRLITDYRYPADYLNDLTSVYRESFSARAARRGKAARIDKPWRTYMRLARVIPQARGKEQNNLRNAVITNLIGKRTASLKLRPSARVGLEWARLAAGA
jgi:CRISPR-associated protein Csm1